MPQTTGGFTLPGEAGYEKHTLDLAERWGADVIRDSDGTKLSDEILNSDYGIYSTICIVREHNDWIRAHPNCQQQTFLCSEAVTAMSEQCEIPLLNGYFTEQFAINDSPESLRYWQVFDRTENREIPAEAWHYENGTVTVDGCTPWHRFTANFICYRIWEEISMYTHVTNSWDKEHLMQLDPRHKDAQEYLLCWLRNWCEEHPQTTVVRFTSLFYNFVWIWGAEETYRNRFTDWASYDFTVSPLALDLFEQEYGYRLTSEDFINKGKLHATHLPADRRKLDWMDFIHRFVTDFARKLVDIVHEYGKKAYVFYDDSWVGMEPYGPHFADIGFDGLIKCVFSGFEARLCAGVPNVTHELRLHPYLFPVGLGGLPTFSDGGDPAADARLYWTRVRRALLRAPIDRIGLGGYLHLTEPFPEFVDCIAEIADEFREIASLHRESAPYTIPLKVGVLTAWGKLRSWTLSGHFHETFQNPLIHLIESLSGLPIDVEFLSFDEVENGVPEGFAWIINAGFAGSAWSGGDRWENPAVVASLTKWVAEGGCFLGVDEPSALPGYQTEFRLAHILGVDLDRGERICHGRRPVAVSTAEGIPALEFTLPKKNGLYLTDADATVLAMADDLPTAVCHPFGKGMGIYLSGYTVGKRATRWLLDLLLWGAKLSAQPYLTDNAAVEAAWYPEARKLVLINGTSEAQNCTVRTDKEPLFTMLPPSGMRIFTL